MTISTFLTSHVRVETAKVFAEVTRDFERQLGKFDPAVLPLFQSDSQHVDDARNQIEAMAGESGLMLFSIMDHGELLALLGERRKAVQYLLGNPLIAIEMTRHNLGAGLYAPLRVLIYEREQGTTCLEYDQPSSLLGQFNDDRIASVASLLDRKLEGLVRAATDIHDSVSYPLGVS